MHDRILKLMSMQIQPRTFTSKCVCVAGGGGEDFACVHVNASHFSNYPILANQGPLPTLPLAVGTGGETGFDLRRPYPNPL